MRKRYEVSPSDASKGAAYYVLDTATGKNVRGNGRWPAVYFLRERAEHAADLLNSKEEHARFKQALEEIALCDCDSQDYDPETGARMCLLLPPEICLPENVCPSCRAKRALSDAGLQVFLDKEPK